MNTARKFVEERTVGDKLRGLLETVGMSVTQLADRANLSVSGLYDIINNKVTDPKISTIEACARVLGIEPEYFLTSYTMGPEEIFPYLTPEQRKFILDSGHLDWIELSLEAVQEGLTPEDIREMIDIIRKHRFQKKK